MSLENELKKQTERAEKWKALAASFHSGMSHIFQEYEKAIDGCATPTIDTGGLYRCCVEGVKSLIEFDTERKATIYTCDKCGGIAELSENTWKAVL